MTDKRRDKAFSLAETLLAVGTLAVGMLFIAGTFLTGIHLTALAAERTTAAVVADEAFTKIRLYATGNPIDPRDDIDLSRLTTTGLVNFTDAFDQAVTIDPDEFAYPSTGINIAAKQYYWSALCRRVDPNVAGRLVQVTVFATRKAGSAASYRGGAGRPIPMPVAVSAVPGNNVLTIEEPDKISWINDGFTIVDNQTAQIYRVLWRYTDRPNMIELDSPWQSGQTGTVWVVPPPRGAGKNPCIAIYQKVIRF